MPLKYEFCMRGINNEFNYSNLILFPLMHSQLVERELKNVWEQHQDGNACRGYRVQQRIRYRKNSSEYQPRISTTRVSTGPEYQH